MTMPIQPPPLIQNRPWDRLVMQRVEKLFDYSADPNTSKFMKRIADIVVINRLMKLRQSPDPIVSIEANSLLTMEAIPFADKLEASQKIVDKTRQLIEYRILNPVQTLKEDGVFDEPDSIPVHASLLTTESILSEFLEEQHPGNDLVAAKKTLKEALNCRKEIENLFQYSILP